MVLVRVTPVHREPKKNPNGTGCFDANGQEIEYGQTVQLSEVGNLKFAAERSNGMESGFFAKVCGGRIYFEPFGESYQQLQFSAITFTSSKSRTGLTTAAVTAAKKEKSLNQ